MQRQLGSGSDLRGSPSKIVTAKHALNLLAESAKDTLEPLKEEDFGTIQLVCAEQPLFDAVFDEYTECLRSIGRNQPLSAIWLFLQVLVGLIGRTSNAKGVVHSFHIMFDELLIHRTSTPKEEDALTQIISKMMSKLTELIRPESVVIVMALFTAMQRFSTISALRSKLLSMFHAKDYFCLELLGSGQFSDVYKGFHKITGRPAAIKKMKYLTASEAVQRALTREVQYSPLGDLENYIKRRNAPFEVAEVSHLMTEMALGLRFLRSKSIVHRDLKPANILLFPNQQSPNRLVLKLCDFTMARELVSGDMAKTLCGSPLYMAPEVLNRQRYTDKADLWSVGVIMYRLLFNRLPYTGVNEWDLRENLNKAELYLPPEAPLTEATRDLLFGLLQKDPLLRISWDEFFAHEFLERDSLGLNSPLSPRQESDPGAQIAELQVRLKEYADRMSKANSTIQRLDKELADANQREAVIQQQASMEKQALEKRLSEAEAVIDVLKREQAHLQQELQRQIRQQATFLSRSGIRSLDPDRMDLSTSSGIGGSAMGGDDQFDSTTEMLSAEIARIRDLQEQRRSRSPVASGLSSSDQNPMAQDDRMVEDMICDLMSKTQLLDHESKRFQVERFTLQTELNQYKTLFEAAADESAKVQAQLRESKAMETLLRDELREKEQILRERILMEVQYQEQLQTLEMQLRNARDEITSYENLFKQEEQRRMMLAQAAQQSQHGQMPQHIIAQGEYPPRSPQPQPSIQYQMHQSQQQSQAQHAQPAPQQPQPQQPRRGGGISGFFGFGGGGGNNSPVNNSPAKK